MQPLKIISCLHIKIKIEHGIKHFKSQNPNFLLGKEACNPAQKIINIHKFKLTLNCIRVGGGGSMVPNICFFFYSRILTPQYIGLIIFVIA